PGLQRYPGALPQRAGDLHGGGHLVARVHGGTAGQRVPGALLGSAAPYPDARRLHPRLLLHLAAARPARGSRAQPHAVRVVQRRDAAPVLERLPAPGLRPPERGRRPRLPLGRGAARDPRRQRSAAVRARRREAAGPPPGAVRDVRIVDARSRPPIDAFLGDRTYAALEGTVANVRARGWEPPPSLEARDLTLFHAEMDAAGIALRCTPARVPRRRWGVADNDGPLETL